MSLDGVYDDNNIFAKILSGAIPSHKVYEDERVLAFMDVMPQSRGHLLAISKTAKARNMLDVAPDDLQALILVVQRLARAVRTALAPDGIVVAQYNGAPAGQTIFHLHVHVVPRYADAPLGDHAGQKADPAELADLARRIAAAMD